MKRYLFALLFCFATALFGGGVGRGAPYCPADEIRILSTYPAQYPGRAGHTQQWVVMVRDSGQGGCVVEFFLQNDTSSGPVCTLTAHNPGHEGASIKLHIRGGERDAVFSKIMVVQGLPVPCDMLPIKMTEKEKVFKERRTAGGTGFAQWYKVVKEPTSWDEASRKGWVKKINTSVRGQLTLFSVFDRRGRLVARQLWQQGLDWWLYEENGKRQSWLVFPSW